MLVISHALWQQRFGGRSDILDQTIRLNATTYTIVGVMPSEFAFPDRTTRAWMPLHVPPLMTPGRPGFSLSMFQAIGRLREGVTPSQAAAEGTARGRNAPAHAPSGDGGVRQHWPVEVTAIPVLDALTGEVKPAILVLLAAVILCS